VSGSWLRTKLLGLRHVLFDEDPLPDRPTLNFTGACTIVDNTSENRLDIDIATTAVTVTGSAPISVSGPATARVVAISAASGGGAGSLSAADYTKLASMTAGAAVASVGATAPILNTGSALAPVIAVAPASSLTEGSQSIAHFDLLDGATADPDVDTLALRGASGEIQAAYLWDGVTGPGAEGLVRVSEVVGLTKIVTAYDGGGDTSIPVVSYDYTTGSVVVGGAGTSVSAQAVDIVVDGGGAVALTASDATVEAPTTASIEVTGGASLALTATTATLGGGGATGVLGATAFTSSVPVVAPYYAATLTSIASAGLLRATSSSQTIVAALKSGGGADVSLLAIDGSDGVTVGDATDAASITVASASGVKLADGAVVHTVDATSISFDSAAGAITVAQAQRGSTGANAGTDLTVKAQQGQAQTGGAANNNGGTLLLGWGTQGTGGGGAAGTPGNVDLGASLADHGGGRGVIGIATSTTAPTTSPSGGVVLMATGDGALLATAKGATTTPTRTVLAPPITDTGAEGCTRWDVAEDRVIKVTDDGTTITLWSYTPNAGEEVRAIVEVGAIRGNVSLSQLRRLRINVGDAAPSLLAEDMETTDTDTGIYTGGGSAVVYDYSGGDVRVRVTADNAVGTKWWARVQYQIFEP
jgi:hypothetical protein